MRFCKKSAVIEAIRYTGENVEEVRAFLGCPYRELEVCPSIFVFEDSLGWSFQLRAGGWVVRDAKGEYFPASAEVIESVYEPVPGQPEPAPEPPDFEPDPEQQAIQEYLKQRRYRSYLELKAEFEPGVQPE